MDDNNESSTPVCPLTLHFNLLSAGIAGVHSDAWVMWAHTVGRPLGKRFAR